ncbi:O-antigen biosynthesis protein [Legionella lansingensis]|uniref:O-antigen biosynthesis protein n=1 Tax=Legionella lansingensis TaxID=45067 RepID=A0A0W0VJX4_9GAMM|nr:O-antigen ligase family protein [Legionella lansingensis]KTD20399.1 O-antigen biosynthesis protein [Legionella lansingensis]SNV51595.1 O-antigen biosynthesis protein [Legionella lansingensis]
METSLHLVEKFPWQKWASLLLAITLLAVPISSTAKSIGIALSVLTILLSPSLRADIWSVLSEKWCIAAYILFLLAVIACFWSPAAFADKAFVIEKYSKLLYLPILVAGFQHGKTRQMSIHAFLLAMIITSTLSILKFHGYLQSFNFKPDFVFRNHIMTGFMVAFATYLSCLLAHRRSGYTRSVYVLLAIFFTYHVLFVNSGRTGYVMYFLLMGLFTFQFRTLRHIVMWLLLVISVFLMSYFKGHNSVMKTRVNDAAQQVQSYKQNKKKNTDIGHRLQFHHFAHELLTRHVLFGNGTASFTYYFQKEKPVSSWTWRLWEPHSQYWLVAAEFGLTGLAALLFFFFSLFMTSLQLDKTKAVALAMLIPFMIGNLSDSLLFYSGSGYFFLLFMALCLGEKVEMGKRKNG